MQEASSNSVDVALPGLRKTLQVDLRTKDWDALIDLLSWLRSRQCHIDYVRTRTDDRGWLQVCLGLEQIGGETLSEHLAQDPTFEGTRIEHQYRRARAQGQAA